MNMRMIYKANVGYTVADDRVEPLLAVGFTMKPTGPVSQTQIPSDARIDSLLEAKPVKKKRTRSPKKKIEE